MVMNASSFLILETEKHFLYSCSKSESVWFDSFTFGHFLLYFLPLLGEKLKVCLFINWNKTMTFIFKCSHKSTSENIENRILIIIKKYIKQKSLCKRAAFFWLVMVEHSEIS